MAEKLATVTLTTRRTIPERALGQFLDKLREGGLEFRLIEGDSKQTFRTVAPTITPEGARLWAAVVSTLEVVQEKE